MTKELCMGFVKKKYKKILYGVVDSIKHQLQKKKIVLKYFLFLFQEKNKSNKKLLVGVFMAFNNFLANIFST